jgi:hypothetical protein
MAYEHGVNCGVQTEIELQRAQLAFEQTKVNLDKTASEYVREREAEAAHSRRTAEEEVNRARFENEQTLGKLQQIETIRREELRKSRDWRRELDRKLTDCQTLEKECAQLREDLQILRTRFRSNLAKSVHGATAAEDSPREEEVDKPVFSELVRTYVDREKAVSSKLSKLEKAYQAATQRNRVLFDRYRRVLDVMEDVAPEALSQRIPIDENQIPSEVFAVGRMTQMI